MIDLSMGLTPGWPLPSDFLGASPSSGVLGLTVTLSVSNADLVTAVAFGAVPTAILTRTGSTLTVLVPVGLGLGPTSITLTTPRGPLVSAGAFTVTLT